MTRLNASLLALLFACAANGCAGSDAATDTDSDGTSDTKDLCANTAAGQTVGADGCGTAEDGDHDKVQTESDLCPGTAAGAAADAFGCSEEQRAAGAGSDIFAPTNAGTTEPKDPKKVAPDGSIAWAQGILENPPETGTIKNGFMSIVVLPKSEHPMVFEAWAANVTESDDGYHVGGSLFLTTPLGMIPIANATIDFAYGSDRILGIQTLRGDASVPFPGIGLLSGVNAEDLASASVGLDVGANLASLGAPLQGERSYLFFQYQQGFSVSAGPVSFEAPGAEDATLVLDPVDPFVFLRGSLLGLDALGPVEGVGIGVSLRGLIPFAPTTTWGLKDGIGEFDGHLYLSGSIPLKELPMTVSGEVVVDLDPAGTGEPIWDMKKGGSEVGLNGSLDLTVSFLKYFSFDANIGNASVGVKITDSEQRAYFSGVVEPDRSFLPSELPFKVQDRLSVAGLLSRNIDQSYLVADGRYTLDGSGLGKLTGLSLDDLVVANGHMEINKTGFHLVGNLDAGVSITKELSLGGNARIAADFADDPNDFHVDIDGDVKVLGVNLVAAHASITSSGIAVSGKLDNGVTDVMMSGTITASTVELHGEAGVTIDVRAGKDVVNLVTDGAICGYEAVRDGALCGYEAVTSGATCGYEAVTDGGVCGYEIVTDGAVCGWGTIQSAAICGEETVTNAVQCGTHNVCSTIFGWFGAEDICDAIPNTCTLPKTCTDYSAPKTCTNMNLPKTCDDLTHPKTCEDLSAPKSCDDLSKPRTCEHHDLVPDFDFGSVKGNIGITLGTSGLSGKVTGQYCATSDSCTTLAGGRLALGDPMKACIDVPGGLGEFCAPF